MARRREAPAPTRLARRPRLEAPLLRALLAGAILLALLSGVGLAFAYDADPEGAHASVASLAGGLGFLRGLHAWSASASVALAAVALVAAFVDARVADAVGALVALGILLLALLSGGILAFDQHGWESFEHVQRGAALAGIRIGTEDAPEATPLRAILLAHAILVPIALILVTAVRTRVWRPSEARPHWRALAALGLVLALAAILLRPELGPAPIPRLALTRPEWPFLWLAPLQDAWGDAALLVLPAAFALGGVALASASRLARGARLALAWAAALLWLGLTWGALA